jgi:hypothetical protein
MLETAVSSGRDGIVCAMRRFTNQPSKEACNVFMDNSSHKFGAAFQWVYRVRAIPTMCSASEQLTQLREYVSSKVDKVYMSTHNVPWPANAKSVGNWIESKDFEAYMNTFVQTVLDQLKTMITARVQLVDTPTFLTAAEQMAYKVALEHLSYAIENRATNLFGCSKLLDKIKEHVKSKKGAVVKKHCWINRVPHL